MESPTSKEENMYSCSPSQNQSIGNPKLETNDHVYLTKKIEKIRRKKTAKIDSFGTIEPTNSEEEQGRTSDSIKINTCMIPID